MTKFMQAKFGTGANSKAYVDNFDRIFRNEERQDDLPPQPVDGGWDSRMRNHREIQEVIHGPYDRSVTPKCRDCGKEHQQDVSGTWWPSCECEVMR